MTQVRDWLHRLDELISEGAFAIVIVISMAVAAYALTPAASLELESLPSTGSVGVKEDSRASGGKYLLFGVVAATQPQTQAHAGSAGPASGGTGSTGGTSGGSQQGGGGTTTPTSSWPASFNTGYPHGLAGDTRTAVTLTPYTGPCTITTANTVIDSKDINCRINVRAANVTIKNSRIRVSNESAINVNDVYHATIIDTELDGQRADNSAGGISLIGDGSYTLIRVDAHSSGDIARINWGGVAIIDSYLHDPYCLQSSCHNDVTQSTDSSCTLGVDSINGTIAGTSDSTDGQWCVKLVHNTMENPNTQTSNILLKADQGIIHHVLVENNLFNGGGYTVYWYDSGYQISDGTIRNNRFRRAVGGGYWPNGGYYGPIASNVSDSSRWPTWSNNVWDDSGAQIAF